MFIYYLMCVDTLSITFHNNTGSSLNVHLLSNRIAWTTDVESKFGNLSANAKGM